MKRIMWKLFRYPRNNKRATMWEAYISDKDKRKVRGRVYQ